MGELGGREALDVDALEQRLKAANGFPKQSLGYFATAG